MLQQNDYAQILWFCCCARFRHPSHTKSPIRLLSLCIRTLAFSIFEGPPKRNRRFWFPVFLPGHSRSRFFCGPPTHELTLSMGFHHPYSWHFLWAVLGHLGAFLGPSWGLLGAVLGHLGGRLGSILGHLGAIANLATRSGPKCGLR